MDALSSDADVDDVSVVENGKHIDGRTIFVVRRGEVYPGAADGEVEVIMGGDQAGSIMVESDNYPYCEWVRAAARLRRCLLGQRDNDGGAIVVTSEDITRGRENW